MPGIYMGLRTIHDPIPEGERVFMMASDKKALMSGEVPVKVSNFMKKEAD